MESQNSKQQCTRVRFPREYKQFCKYVIKLEYYQSREVSEKIYYCKNFRYSPKQTLSTEIKRYIAEFGSWDKDWDVNDVAKRIRKGWRFYVLRPKIGIRGWVWISPRGHIEDLYVSKKYRHKGYGRALIYQALNDIAGSSYSKATIVFDAWNNRLKYFIEHIIKDIHCLVQISGFEIKVKTNKGE